MIKDFDHVHKATFETDFGKESYYKKSILNLGIKFLLKHITEQDKQLLTEQSTLIKDMKDLKLRVPNASSNLDYAKYSGAAPTPMAFSEVY